VAVLELQGKVTQAVLHMPQTKDTAGPLVEAVREQLAKMVVHMPEVQVESG
jgi:hypothetical protein